MRIEMDQGNEQIDFGGAWQTLIFWICNFDFANPPMASRLQATAKSAGMHMAAAEAGDLGDFCTDFCIDFWRPFMTAAALVSIVTGLGETTTGSDQAELAFGAHDMQVGSVSTPDPVLL